MTERELGAADVDAFIRLFGGCVDCHADSYLDETTPGFFRLVVAHDHSCPFYNQRRRVA